MVNGTKLNLNSKKILYSLLLICALIVPISAADISVDKNIYEVGDTLQVTISDCSDGSSATANIPSYWAGQGVISGGSWSDSYTIPSTFANTGNDITINGYCGETVSANFCVNPGCSEAETDDEDSSSGGSGGGGGGGGSTFNLGTTTPAPTPEPMPEPTVTSKPDPTLTPEPEEESEPITESEESSNFIFYMLGLILIIGAIAGIIYFIKKRKSPPQNPIQSPIQPQNPIAPIQ